MFKNLTQFAGLLRNAGQMTKKVQESKAELGKTIFQKTSTSETVIVKMNGLGEVQSIEIVLEKFEVESDHHKTHLEKEILEAVNAGIVEARRLHVEAIKKLTNGLDIPMIDNLIAELAD